MRVPRNLRPLPPPPTTEQHVDKRLLDIKRMSEQVAMATERVQEMTRLRDEGKLTPEHEEAMWESIATTLADVESKVKP